MSKRHDPRQRGWGACMLMALLLPVAAHADGPLAGVLVRDMLDIDARRALITERQAASGNMLPAGSLPSVTGQFQGQQADSPTPDSTAAMPCLTGIAGVGARLTAIIQVEGQQTHYVSGRADPATGPDLGLKLRRIKTPCAFFEDQSGSAVTLCLNGETP